VDSALRRRRQRLPHRSGDLDRVDHQLTTANIRWLYFVAPETAATESCRLRALHIATSPRRPFTTADRYQPRKANTRSWVLDTGTIVVTVGMATNGGLTWRLPTGTSQVVECGSRDWLFQVSESEDRALEGDGDLFLTDWPSGVLRATTRVRGYAIGACFLDDLWAVAFSAGEGAAMIRLDTMDAGPTIPFGEGESWCLAHQHGPASPREDWQGPLDRHRPQLGATPRQ